MSRRRTTSWSPPSNRWSGASNRRSSTGSTRAACVVIDEAHGSVTPSYTTILNQLGLTPRETPVPLVGLTATPFRGGAEDGGPETIRLVRRYGGRRFDHGVFGDDGSYPRLRRMGVLSDAEFARLGGVSFELSEPELEQFRQFDRLPANVEARIGRDHGRNDRIIERIAGLPREWATLVFAASVDHAELLAAELSVRGIAAQAVSSRTDAVARRHAIEGVQKERNPGAHQLRCPDHGLRRTEDAGRVRHATDLQPRALPAGGGTRIAWACEWWHRLLPDRERRRQPGAVRD